MRKVHETNDWLLTEEIAATEPILVLFDASEGWKQTGTDTAFTAAAAQHEGPARFFRIDVDENPSVAQVYRLKKLPSVILFLEGKELSRRAGELQARDILDLLARKPKGA